MAQTIALAGKGGVGKTTICGMLIEYLCQKKNGPVLAVDADANSNLNEVLGVEVHSTLGEIREEIAQAEMSAKNPIPAGMSKADYAEMQFSDALTEADDYDLLVMGRTQGKGCYCFVTVCSPLRWPSMPRTTAISSWTTRRALSTSAAASCPRWIPSSWSATAPAAAYRPPAASAR